MAAGVAEGRVSVFGLKPGLVRLLSGCSDAEARKMRGSGAARQGPPRWASERGGGWVQRGVGKAGYENKEAAERHEAVPSVAQLHLWLKLKPDE